MTNWLLMLLMGFTLSNPFRAPDTRGPSTAPNGWQPQFIASFDSFTVPTMTAAGIKSAIQNTSNRFIYLKPVDATIDNPIVIDRTAALGGDLMIYGSGMGTVLRMQNENQPMFRVDGCTNVTLAHMSITPSNLAWQDEYALIQQAPTTCNINTSQMAGNGYVMNGPGRLFSELTRLNDSNDDGGYIADHADAEIVLLGGDITSSGASDGTGNQWHVWIKQGWLSVWGTSMEGTPGTAAIRIDDSTAGDPPHYIVGVRDEGHPAALDDFENRFIQMSGDADVVALGNTAAWSLLTATTPALVNATGTGTLWAIGNVCEQTEECTAVVDGTLTNVTVVAIGNLIKIDEVPPAALATHRAHNLWHNFVDLRMELVDATNDVDGFPMPTKVSPPHALRHPRMTVASALAFGWENVKTDYSAVGDGVTDDTTAIQNALDSGCLNDAAQVNVAPRVFFPAGTYKLTAPLTFDVIGGVCFEDYLSNTSFIMAGEGPTTTVLRTTDAGEGIFESNGTRSPLIQDLGFDLVDGTFTQPGTYAGIAMDFVDRNVVFYGALLHRVWVSGGNAAVVFGHTDPCDEFGEPAGLCGRGNSSESICSYCLLEDAGVAFASDHANAINNFPVDSELKDSAYAVAPGYNFGVTGSTGKGALGFYVKMTGITVAITPKETASPSAFVASHFYGTAPRFYPGTLNGTTAASNFILHDSFLNVVPVPQVADAEWFRQHRSGGGLITLDSWVSGADVQFEDYAGQRFFTALRGDFSRYASGVTLGTNSLKSKTGF